MSPSNGFDRMSTEEELHQVLDTLSKSSDGNWMLDYIDGSSLSSESSEDASFDEALDFASLSQLIQKKQAPRN